MCCVVRLEGERNDRTFRGVERDSSDMWFLVRFYVSLWALVVRLFCNYSLKFYFI